MSMSSQLPRFSSDSKRKKPALPSLLSNIRNAQAAIGRAAADDSHERETRPLVSAGGGGGLGGGGGVRTTAPAPSNRPQLSRSAQTASFSATLQNFSQRFGSQWRKRSRRKKGQGVTVVPQSFYLAVGCFFFAFPFFFVLFILARHAVFGDEEGSSSTTVHKHEVPASLGITHEHGNDPLGINIADGINPEDDIRMYNGLNHTSVHGDATAVMQVVEGGDHVIEHPAGGHDDADQIVGQDQSEGKIASMIQTNFDREDGTKNNLQHGPMHNVTRLGNTNILSMNEIKPGNELKDVGGNPKQAAIPLKNDMNDAVKAGSAFEQVIDEGRSHLQEKHVETRHSKTGASSDDMKDSSNAMVANDAKPLMSQEDEDN